MDQKSKPKLVHVTWDSACSGIPSKTSVFDKQEQEKDWRISRRSIDLF
jgi:hypothetical protein